MSLVKLFYRHVSILLRPGIAVTALSLAERVHMVKCV